MSTVVFPNGMEMDEEICLKLDRYPIYHLCQLIDSQSMETL
ncbi:unnamed protein product [Acidithrix sp. C25]|nr:unnamed protein product [Acidithrix sp. C25]